MVKNIFIVVISILLLVSCAIAQKNNEDYITQFRTKYQTVPFLTENNSKKEPENIRFSANIYDSLQLYEDSIKLIYKNREIYVKGYSVLAYNGNNKEEGLQLRSNILKHYPEENVELNYIAPNFKLKVGPFEDRLDAIRIKEHLLKLNFSSALVVPDNILIEQK